MSIIILTFLLIALCLQHLIHEYAHVLVANLLGEKVLKIQWFTYGGGTRVFFSSLVLFVNVWIIFTVFY